MPRGCFDQLCETIKNDVGEKAFRSEKYLEDLKTGLVGTRIERRMYMANSKNGCGYLCGEVKLALALRMLAGGSYLDLSLIFDVYSTSTHRVLKHVVKNWINNSDAVADLNGISYLNDVEEMSRVASQFATRSNGLFTGCIGALDGWLVRIRSPQAKDGVDTPGDYFSRKGFYCVNVQVIVDKKKRVLYRSIISRGAEHDSTAFRNSSLYKELLEKGAELAERNLYFIGDSAYAIRSFLLTPVDNTLHGQAGDNYNYYHSSSRISVECAFGEINNRWGILWKSLGYDLSTNTSIIDACLRLHNFIVNYRETHEQRDGVTQDEEESIFREEIRNYRLCNPNDCTIIHGGEEEVRIGGRPKQEETDSRDEGLRKRKNICDKIETRGIIRPRTNHYR